MSIPDGYLMDAAGRLVPRENVKPEHLLEDEIVRKLHGGAEQRSEMLREFRCEAFSEIQALQELLAEKHGTTKGGDKGNLTLNSYDGTLRVTVAIGDSISFGPEIKVAKELIDSCLTRWAKGANGNLRALVLDAFDVGKEGHLRADKILGLRRLAIDDDEWQRAMNAISEAVRADSSRQYVRFHKRGSPRDGFTQVPLDIARA